jgi:anti-sigma regulatory factor (Ser/Thr protein kinase)
VRFKGYGVAVLATGLVLLVRLALNSVLGERAPLLAFTLPVMLAAWYGGLGPGLFATLLGALAGTYFFVAPALSLVPADTEDIASTVLFALVGLLIATLGGAERRARQQVQAAAVRQRRFLREMLSGMTEGRLRLCDTPADLPVPLPPACDPVELSKPTLRVLRRHVEAVAEDLRLPKERGHDLILAAGEAAMNAVVHAGGGEGRVHTDPVTGTIQVWIRDQGSGIQEESLHRATLEKGFSLAGTMGHGFFMMLQTCDRVWLLTGASGTTVVLEQERNAPEPAWMRDL